MSSTDTPEHHARSKRKVSKLIAQLVSLPKGKSAEKLAITDSLSILAREVGVESDGILALFDLITSGAVSTADSHYIIQEILIPAKSVILPQELIYQIISQIGIPQVYHKNGHKAKSKRLSTPVQTALLEWLVCSIHVFGREVYKTLKRLHPILFNLLSYEYSRAYIANLIFLSVSSGGATFKTFYNKKKTHRVSSFKSWHIQLVVDLYVKFPMDEYLKALLLLFRSSDPQINLQDYSRSQIFDLNNLGTVSTRVFRYPNSAYLSKMTELDENVVSDAILNQNLKEYSEFDQTVKRRKLNKVPIQNDPPILFENISILSSQNRSHVKLQTNLDLIGNLFETKTLKINDLFSGKNSFLVSKLKKLMFMLQINGRKEDRLILLQRLDYFTKLSIIDDNLSVSDSENLINNVTNLLEFGAGTLELPSVVEFVLYGFDLRPISAQNNEALTGIHNLKQRLKILRFLPIQDYGNFSKFLKPTLTFLMKTAGFKSVGNKIGSLLISFVQELILMFQIWLAKDFDQLAFETIAKSLPVVFEFASKTYSTFPTSIEYMIILVFRFIKTLDLDHFNEYFGDDAIVPPPAIVYALLLKGDPLLCSELCGYIAYTKSYKFKMEEKKALQNAYIMDTVNFVWRDKAFYQETSLTSSNKGFYLHPDFQAHVGSLHAFNYSNMMTLPTLGNLFVNPAWAYLSAQIVWKLEDQFSEVSVRHQGPVSKESIVRLQGDVDNIWLSISYDDLKLKILRELDILGFKGLADLLFTSLKTLQNQRHEANPELYDR